MGTVLVLLGLLGLVLVVPAAIFTLLRRFRWRHVLYLTVASVALVLIGALAFPTQRTPAQAQPGARDTPVPFGQAYAFDDRGAKLTFQVLEVQRHATRLVVRTSLTNTSPPEGNDYVLVKVRLNYLSGDPQHPYRITAGANRLYAQNQWWGAPSLATAPEPQIDGRDIFPGAVIEGWLPPKYLPTALEDEAALVYRDVYFALR